MIRFSKRSQVTGNDKADHVPGFMASGTFSDLSKEREEIYGIG